MLTILYIVTITRLFLDLRFYISDNLVRCPKKSHRGVYVRSGLLQQSISSVIQLNVLCKARFNFS